MFVRRALALIRQTASTRSVRRSSPRGGQGQPTREVCRAVSLSHSVSQPWCCEFEPNRGKPFGLGRNQHRTVLDEVVLQRHLGAQRDGRPLRGDLEVLVVNQPLANHSNVNIRV